MHRILQFDKSGDCIAEEAINPKNHDLVASAFNWAEGAYKAQWQFFKEGFGWQGFETYYK